MVFGSAGVVPEAAGHTAGQQSAAEVCIPTVSLEGDEGQFCVEDTGSKA